jgi:macrodomain Ter protein organizer (MatP/YcbG family)
MKFLALTTWANAHINANFNSALKGAIFHRRKRDCRHNAITEIALSPD